MTHGLRSILLVDGDTAERSRAAAALRKKIECVVAEASSRAEALERLAGEDISLLVVSLALPGDDGLELIKQTHREHPGVLTIAAVAEGRRDQVVEVMRAGAYFHVATPYDLSELVIASARALNVYEIQTYRKVPAERVRKSDGFQGIIGQAPSMQRLFQMLERIAEEGSSTVLIHGDSGTGKELVARAIHALSPRRGKNFVPVNCAAIPEELLESELFGYVKGAFTGAAQTKIGRVQYADGGTLFLDEIGDMKPSLQAKLLRVLQEREFEPVGGLKPVPVDVRVVAATHRDLERLVADGQFREDLYYRLSVIPVTIPPLRERREDIPLLIDKFIQVFRRQRETPLRSFASDAMAALQRYPWPGNVRELENLVQRMSILHGGETVALADLPERYSNGRDLPAAKAPERGWEQGTAIDFNERVGAYEAELILKALERAGGNKKEAARLLSLNRTTLIEKIKKKGLDRSLSDQ